MTDRDDFSELISAFLDGEVTSEEKASIEEHLIDNAADRQLFEEMRSIRDSLRSLRRRELGKDLSQSVLRSAERAMLSAEATELSQPHDQRKTWRKDSEGREAAIVATPPSPRPRNNWRTLVWVGLTVAAAVLIMVIGNWPGRQRPVAVHQPAGEPDDVAGEPTSPATANRTNVAETGMADETGTSLPPTLAEGVSEHKRGRYRAVEENAAGVAPHRKTVKDHRDLGAGVAESRVAVDGRGAAMSEDDSSVPESLTRRFVETPKVNKLADAMAEDLFAQSVTEELEGVEISTDRLLVVRLDVSPDAVRAHSLDDTLVRNSVSFEYAAEQLPGIREAFAGGQQRARWEVDQAESHRALRDLDRQQKQLVMAGDGGIVVFAKAPAEQVRAALKDLAQQNNAFQIAGVHAGPPTGAWQEIAKQLNGAEKAKRTAPPAPQGPDSLTDTDSSAVTDAEGDGVEVATAEKKEFAQQTATESEPTDAPFLDAPGAALDSSPPVPGEGVAGRVAGGVAAPEMPAAVQAAEPLEESKTVGDGSDREARPDVAGTPRGRAGGFGGGMVGKSPLSSDAVSGWKGDGGTGQLGQKKLAEASRSASTPQMVQVLFVLRTVAPPAAAAASPPANIAADVPPGQPPAAAARILHVEADAAAEAAKGVIEPAEPAVRD